MRSDTIIPQALQDKVNNELDNDEIIEWMYMPIPHYFKRMSLAMFLFAIPWTAFAFFWIYGASGFEMPDFSKGGASLFPLFGLPFVLVGIGMLSSSLWTYKKLLRPYM